MCRLVLVLLVLLVPAPLLFGQASRGADSRDRRLLLRADSLLVWHRSRRLAAGEAQRLAMRARPESVERLDALVPGAARHDSVHAGLDSAWALLVELGAVPDAFLGSLVLVARDAEDTAAALAGARYAGRGRVVFGPVAHSGPVAIGSAAALAVLRAYRQTLDAEWRAWLPADYGLRRSEPLSDGLSWRDFSPAWSVAGAGCLAGSASACRHWLGLDREPDPYAARFLPAELRGYYERDWWSRGQSRSRACLAGSDVACVAFARESGRPPVVAAGNAARRSVLRAVREIHGPQAIARALADTSGSLGERLARASGVPEDSVVMQWRRWSLGQGRPTGSRLGGREALPALLFAGLLLFAASGSGRWR